MTTRNSYEPAEEYTADGYAVAGWGAGIAFSVLGWETEPDEETEWSGFEARTGNLVVRMIGDDQNFSVDPEDVTRLAREAYCGECGQVGCGHDGYDRAAAS